MLHRGICLALLATGTWGMRVHKHITGAIQAAGGVCVRTTVSAPFSSSTTASVLAPLASLMASVTCTVCAQSRHN